MSLDSLMIDSVRVKSLVTFDPANLTLKPPQDPGGGFLRTYRPGATVPCNVQCEAGTRADKDGRVSSVIVATIYLAADPGFGTTDQLEWLTSKGASKADAQGKYPLITLESPAIDQTSRGVFKATGLLHPAR